MTNITNMKTLDLTIIKGQIDFCFTSVISRPFGNILFIACYCPIQEENIEWSNFTDIEGFARKHSSYATIEYG